MVDASSPRVPPPTVSLITPRLISEKAFLREDTYGQYFKLESKKLTLNWRRDSKINDPFFSELSEDNLDHFLVVNPYYRHLPTLGVRVRTKFFDLCSK